MPSKNNFEAVSATLCCYNYGAKAYEEVQKISKDQTKYRKCCLCVIICWKVKIYLSINNWKMDGYRDTFHEAEAAEVAQKKEQ